MTTPRRRSRRGLWLSLLLVVSGLFWIWCMVGMLALDLHLCVALPWDVEEETCLAPVGGILVGVVIALYGFLGCLWVAFRAWRRARAPAPA